MPQKAEERKRGSNNIIEENNKESILFIPNLFRIIFSKIKKFNNEINVIEN